MQVIIDHHYNVLYRINFCTVVIPAIVQAIFFWFWHNFVLIVRMRSLLREKLDSAEVVDRLLKTADGKTKKVINSIGEAGTLEN